MEAKNKIVNLHQVQEKMFELEKKSLKEDPKFPDQIDLEQSIYHNLKKAWIIFDCLFKIENYDGYSHKFHNQKKHAANQQEDQDSFNDSIKKGRENFNKGDYHRALFYFNMAITIPTDIKPLVTIYVNLSAIYYEMREYDNCLKAIDKVLEMNKLPKINLRIGGFRSL